MLPQAKIIDALEALWFSPRTAWNADRYVQPDFVRRSQIEGWFVISMNNDWNYMCAGRSESSTVKRIQTAMP